MLHHMVTTTEVSQQTGGRESDQGLLAFRRHAAGPVNIIFYCHDSYGLGHLRRTLTLARYLRACAPAINQLIVTGSPLAHDLLLPEDGDYVKLPSVVKTGQDEYASRSLPLPFERMSRMRAEIIESVARNVRPDAFLVDHAPAGLRGELIPALRQLRRSSDTRLILGLRDVVDDAPRVRASWRREGVYELLEEVYDLVLVYGDPAVYDVVSEYGLSPRVARKTRYVGYLARDSERTPQQVRHALGLRTGRFVVATVGGGGDGVELLEAMLRGLQRSNGHFDTLVVAGPLMPAEPRERLAKLADACPLVRLVSYVDDLPSTIAAADVVVSMGGYNSICEILSAERPAVIVPRVTPRREQLIRAEALSERGFVRTIHPDDVTPAGLIAEIDDLLGRVNGDAGELNLNGLPAAAAELEAVLYEGAHAARTGTTGR
jgi:predicted glycosyltransferase